MYGHFLLYSPNGKSRATPLPNGVAISCDTEAPSAGGRRANQRAAAAPRLLPWPSSNLADRTMSGYLASSFSLAFPHAWHPWRRVPSQRIPRSGVWTARRLVGCPSAQQKSGHFHRRQQQLVKGYLGPFAIQNFSPRRCNSPSAWRIPAMTGHVGSLRSASIPALAEQSSLTRSPQAVEARGYPIAGSRAVL